MGRLFAQYLLRSLAGIALFLGILVFAWRMGSEKVSKPHKERNILTKHYRMLKHGSLRYSVRYPRSWRERKVRDGVIVATLNQDRESGVQIRIYPLEMKADQFRDGFIKGVIRDMGQHHQAVVTLLDEQEIAVADSQTVSAVRYRFQMKKKYTNWLLLNYLYFTPKKVYVFQGGTPINGKEEIFTNYCNEIVRSFKRY